jgi:hypothetical protein
MNKRMSYNDVYEIISLYANDYLPLYADYWNRFPVCENAVKIVQKLKDTSNFYRKMKPELADKIQGAANEVSLHIND